MTKKDYEKAASIVREFRAARSPEVGGCVEAAFVRLFTDSASRFDEVRFRAACEPRPAPPSGCRFCGTVPSPTDISTVTYRDKTKAHRDCARKACLAEAAQR